MHLLACTDFGEVNDAQMWMTAVPTAPGRCRCLWWFFQPSVGASDRLRKGCFCSLATPLYKFYIEGLLIQDLHPEIPVEMHVIVDSCQMYIVTICCLSWPERLETWAALRS